MSTSVLLVVLVLLHLCPVLFWMGIYFSRDSGKKEPRILILKTFGMGIFATLPLFLLYMLQSMSILPSPQGSWVLLYLFFYAFVEEMLKHLGAIHVMNAHTEARNEVSDGILYAVSAALGFSFAENIFYALSEIYKSGALDHVLTFVLMRNLLSMFAHTVFSSIFGYAYALAYIAPDMRVITRSSVFVSIPTLLRKVKWSSFLFPILRHTVALRLGRKNDKIWEGANAMSLVAEGYILAALAHGLYNMLLGSYYAYLSFPLLFLLGCGVFCFLKKKI